MLEFIEKFLITYESIILAVAKLVAQTLELIGILIVIIGSISALSLVIKNLRSKGNSNIAVVLAANRRHVGTAGSVAGFRQSGHGQCAREHRQQQEEENDPFFHFFRTPQSSKNGKIKKKFLLILSYLPSDCQESGKDATRFEARFFPINYAVFGFTPPASHPPTPRGKDRGSGTGSAPRPPEPRGSGR